MDAQRRQWIRSYAIAFASVAAAGLVRFVLSPVLVTRLSSSPFLIAILVAGRYGGIGPAWLALAIGTLPIIYLQFWRPGDYGPWNLPATTAVVVYILFGAAIVMLTRSERRAREAAEQNAADARRQQKLLEHEIAERQLIEQQLRERQQHLELALEAGRLGIWSWDLESGMIRSTETQAILHGRPLDRLYVHSSEPPTYVHPDDRPIVAEAMRRAVLDQPLERIVYRTRWPDGSTHWIDTVGKVFHDEAGKPNRVLGVSTDITERRQSELDLRQAVERFKLLAMHAPVGIAQSDAEGRLFFVNQKWCEITGVQPEEVQGFGWQNVLHPVNRESAIQAWAADTAADKPNVQTKCRFIRKDGTVRWFSSISSLVHDAGGRPVGQIGIIEDITQRIAIEEALRKTESQFRGILDHASAVIYLKDLDGKYILVNRRCELLFGTPDDSTVGKTDFEIFSAENATEFRKADRQVIEARSPMVFEELALQEDGEHTYRSVKFPVMDASGNVVALGGISTDISDLKEAHEALKKQEGLLRTLIEVGEQEKRFQCHEFHDGLIQYAVGSLFLLESLSTDNLSSEDASKLDIARTKLRYGIEEGRRVIRGIRPAVLDDSKMEDAIHDLLEQYCKSDIMVTFNCDPDIGRLPETVQTTLYRVVQEALTNAKKHSGTDVVRIELRKPNGEIHLDIQDFGCGFDVNNARAGCFGLLGMTERVRLLGGDCQILSEKDMGTRIIARVPGLSLNPVAVN
jgi:PAS domain S-box-containing protein